MRITLTIRAGSDPAEGLRMAARCLEMSKRPQGTIFGRDGMYLLATRTKSGGFSFRQCTELPKQEQPQ